MFLGVVGFRVSWAQSLSLFYFLALNVLVISGYSLGFDNEGVLYRGLRLQMSEIIRLEAMHGCGSDFAACGLSCNNLKIQGFRV